MCRLVEMFENVFKGKLDKIGYNMLKNVVDKCFRAKLVLF